MSKLYVTIDAILWMLLSSGLDVSMIPANSSLNHLKNKRIPFCQQQLLENEDPVHVLIGDPTYPLMP